MRHWLFHPIIFYPLVAAFAALVIAFSLQPQSWPRPPAPVHAERSGEWLVFQGNGFNSPRGAANQEMTVVRDFWGRPQALRVAERGRGQPSPADTGVRVLLSQEDANALIGKAVTVEVSYNPLSVNAATGLAVSLSGDGPSHWVSQPAPPQTATLRFRLPAQNSVNGIAVRAITDLDDQAYGLEITRIRVTPQT